MKNYLLKLASVLFLGTLVFSGCKKGADDPFISLRSRDGRLTGDWKLSSETIKQTDISYDQSSGSTTTSVTSSTFDGTTLTTSFGGSSFTSSYSLELVINDDGTYNATEIVDGATTTLTDYWSWLDDTKNKVKISIMGTEYYIDELKNSEMILKIDSESKDTKSNGDYDQSTVTATYTYTKQ